MKMVSTSSSPAGFPVARLNLRVGDHGPLLREVRSPVVILVEGTVAHVNPALEALLEKTGDALRDARFTDLLHPDDREKISRWLEQIPSGNGESLQMDFRLRLETGGSRWVNARLVDASWEGRPAVAGFLSDIEDRRRSRSVEEQLRQSQKMEAVGRLAGGVAHDMNNLLGAIMGFASVLQAEIEPDSRTRSDVDHILEACRKGRDLMLNLLGFARRGKYRLEKFAINDRIDGVVQLLKHTIPKKIVISTNLHKKTLEIHGDPTQIHHAVMNICINAVDAMGDTGILALTTDALDLRDHPMEEYPDLEPGMYARIKISDTGPGMTRDILEMAFEPFFTTKPVGQGSGLGLPMVYGTIKNHGGRVIIESSTDKGTSVIVLLPTGSTPSQSLKIVGDRRTPSDPAKRTILLVDDEPMIREVGERLLEKLGYRVLLAPDGREALRLFSQKKDTIDAVMLDMIMPVMNGAETLAMLKEVDPDIPVLLCSGYSKEEGAEDLVGEGADAFIQKPFDLSELRRSLAAVMEE